MRDINPGCLNFLNKKDPQFKPLRGTLDALFHKLHSEGLGTEIKSAEVFTQDDDTLWSTGVTSQRAPKPLQNAAFFMAGKMFCLCGGVEDRGLKLSQLKKMHSPDRYVYYKHVSKKSQQFVQAVAYQKQSGSIVCLSRGWRKVPGQYLR